MPDFIRIGDAERDEAVSLLREHHAAGRLTSVEFDERVGRALQAKVADDLAALFSDLPGRKPGQPRSVPTGAPVAPSSPVQPYAVAPTYGAASPVAAAPAPNNGQRAQWVILAVVAVIVVMSGMRLFPLLIVAVVWVLISSRRHQSAPKRIAPPPPRLLTRDGHRTVLHYLSVGDDAMAFSTYQNLTGADPAATDLALRALAREVGR